MVRAMNRILIEAFELLVVGLLAVALMLAA
jgi:hypothetical protein